MIKPRLQIKLRNHIMTASGDVLHILQHIDRRIEEEKDLSPLLILSDTLFFVRDVREQQDTEVLQEVEKILEEVLDYEIIQDN